MVLAETWKNVLTNMSWKVNKFHKVRNEFLRFESYRAVISLFNFFLQGGFPSISMHAQHVFQHFHKHVVFFSYVIRLCH